MIFLVVFIIALYFVAKIRCFFESCKFLRKNLELLFSFAPKSEGGGSER